MKSKDELPIGQREIGRIMKWGTDHPGITRNIPRLEKKSWTLTVNGMVENPVILSWDEFLKLPFDEVKADFHCVEGWSVKDCLWGGVRFKRLVKVVKPKKGARIVFFECEDGYTTSLTLDELQDNSMLAHKLNGQDLGVGLGAPVRLFVLDKYAYKSPMWVRKITFTDKKELGYWEKRGYSDTADPWNNDRYR
jgi:DMSO/TMAO reductase YedYZ molybdopterin-dependent catalytic subunit